MFAADILAAILLATASICSALKPPLTLMLLPLEPAATGAREEAVMSERTLPASARRASASLVQGVTSSMTRQRLVQRCRKGCGSTTLGKAAERLERTD